jgi:general secretion pathway protein M
MERIKTIWAARTSREKLALGVLVALAAVVILVYGLWLPLMSAETSAKAHYRRALSQKTEAIFLSQTIKTLTPKPQDTEGDIKTILEGSTQSLEITLSNYQDIDGGLRLVAQANRSQDLFNWLKRLSQTQGLTFSEVSMSKTDEGGIKAELLITKAIS